MLRLWKKYRGLNKCGAKGTAFEYLQKWKYLLPEMQTVAHFHDHNRQLIVSVYNLWQENCCFTKSGSSGRKQ